MSGVENVASNPAQLAKINSGTILIPMTGATGPVTVSIWFGGKSPIPPLQLLQSVLIDGKEHYCIDGPYNERFETPSAPTTHTIFARYHSDGNQKCAANIAGNTIYGAPTGDDKAGTTLTITYGDPAERGIIIVLDNVNEALATEA